MMTDERALVLFSRGQDSATCLAWALETFGWVETVGFDYGQRHRVELEFRVVFRQGKITTNQAWGACLGPDHMLDLSILG